MGSNTDIHKLFGVSQNAIMRNANGEILILKQDGTWMLPGGHINENENWLDGFHREIREETGIADFSILKIVDVDNSDRIYFVTFLCEVQGNPEVKLSAEHQDYTWMKMEEINNYQFRHEKIKKRLLSACESE